MGPTLARNSASGDPTKGSTIVSFRAADGVQLNGRLFGNGDVGIVLSHMGDPENNQADWFSFAQTLASGGFLVLTYDRRGVCPGGSAGCSEGNDYAADAWKDVIGAVGFLKGKGAARVIAIGASIGAMESLRAAEEPDSRIDGLVWIAGVLSNGGYEFHQAEVARLSVPTLVISGAGDPIGAFVDAGILYRWLTGPKQLFLPESHRHGTDMFKAETDPAVVDSLRQTILSWLESIS